MIRQRGLSLIELVIFIVIVSVAIAGVLSVFNVTTQKSADPIVRKQVMLVAEAMLEEVLLKDYANPVCLPSCAANNQADRPNYTSVDNYNGWDQTGVRNIAGDAIAGLENYRVEVAVVAAALNDITSASGNAKSVTVKATGPGESFTLVGYRTNYP